MRRLREWKERAEKIVRCVVRHAETFEDYRALLGGTWYFGHNLMPSIYPQFEVIGARWSQTPWETNLKVERYDGIDP